MVMISPARATTNPAPAEYTGTVEGVIAQLTSSALKNQAGLTKTIEKLGFFTLDQHGAAIVGTDMPLIEVNGWANAGGGRTAVGQEFWGPGNIVVSAIRVRGEPGIYECTYKVPFTDPPSSPATPMYTLTSTPEWRYEVRPHRGELVGRSLPTMIPAGASSRDEAVRRVVAAAREHRRYTVDLGVGQEVVGHNNVGDISFEWGPADAKFVVQDLWWRPEDAIDAAPLTRYRIHLDNGST